MKNYEAYCGKKFTIEWYFNDQGKSSARDYFMEKEKALRYKEDYIKRIKGGSYYAQ